MIGTLTPLVITHLVITVPIVVWVMIGFFEGLPGELEEAALVDGATIWQAFRYVAMPLARPGITVAIILSFIFSWNNFIFGVVLAGRTTRTLPVAVYNVLTFEQITWGPLAAAALVVTAPVLLLTLVDAEGNRRRPDRRRREGRLRSAIVSTPPVPMCASIPTRRKQMIRRRQLLAASTAISAAPAIVERANAQSAFDWKQFKGQFDRGQLPALATWRSGTGAPT